MDPVGLRELRQDASDLVRRAEAGENLLITVAGRPAAVLGPPERGHWRRADDVVAVLSGPTDDEWAEDVELIDDELVDPWERHRA